MRDVLKISQCKDTKNSLFRASIYGNMHRNLTFCVSFCRFSYSAVIYDLLYNNLVTFQFNLQSFEMVQFLNEDINLILRFPYEMEHQLMCITVTETNCHMIVIRNLGEHLIERHVVKDNSRIAYNLCRPLPRSPSLWVELSSTGVSVCRLLHIASTNRWYVSRVSSSWLMMSRVSCSEYVAGWSSISRSWRTLFKHALVQQMSGYASEKERQIGQMGGKTAQNRCFLQKNNE